jgi:hypothetical protein
MRPRFVIADRWLEQVCASQGIPWDRTQRVIIDAKAGEPVFMYVRLLGDEGLLELDPPEVVEPTVRES